MLSLHNHKNSYLCIIIFWKKYTGNCNLSPHAFILAYLLYVWYKITNTFWWHVLAFAFVHFPSQKKEMIIYAKMSFNQIIQSLQGHVLTITSESKGQGPNRFH